MRASARTVATWSLLLAIAAAVGGNAAEEKESSLAGQWKLILLAFGEDESAILSITEEDGKLNVKVGDVQPFLGEAKAKSIDERDGKLTIVLETGAGESVFSGTVEGDVQGQLLGTFTLQDRLFPARLERSESDKLAQPNRALLQGVNQARRERAPQKRIEKLEQLLDEYSGPSLQHVYTALIAAADGAGTSEDQVRGYLDNWLSEAGRYGPKWLLESRIAALRAIEGKQAYAMLAFETAQKADQELPGDAPLKQQAALTSSLASAARLAGKLDMAEDAEQRLAKLEASLDEEYLAKVPPFEIQKFPGRSNTRQDRVVLLELFTGAQCPPCVAADVGFDAILKTYQPSELVALQCHLHIPGPDPLTNKASEERAAYYTVQGTPSTYFNGESKAGGGGGMDRAQVKYDEYRQIIDQELDASKQAQIDLQVTRSGDDILVTAVARADVPPPGNKQEEQDEEKETAEPSVRLRLALTEEAVRYVGGNELRFHHHVVRAMPGGAEGKELVAGEARVELTITPDQVREQLNEYLEQAAGEREFPKPLPEIKLSGLSVVAFVQDDSDKRVLHAVTMRVPEAE